MDALITKDIKGLIKETLGTDEKPVNEALMAQTKKFTIKTDLLSSDNVQNHFELYQTYVKTFNEISAKLDSVDKSHIRSTLPKTSKCNSKKVGFLFKTNLPSSEASLKSVNSKCLKNVLSIWKENSCFPSLSPTKGIVNSLNTSKT